jgi:hypothetical protein
MEAAPAPGAVIPDWLVYVPAGRPAGRPYPVGAAFLALEGTVLRVRLSGGINFFFPPGKLSCRSRRRARLP